MEEANNKLKDELIDVAYESKEKDSGRTQEEFEVVNITNSLNHNLMKLTEDDARRIIESEILFSRKKKSLQNHLQILNISSSFVYVVSLATFTERRQLFYQFRKHQFKPLDSHGKVCHPWEVAVPDYDKVKPFVDKVKDVYVKNSEHLQNCICANLTDKYDCSFCDNFKRLVYSLNCRVIWRTYKDEYVSSSAEAHLIPLSKLKLAPGEIVYESNDRKVNAIICPENSEITQASKKFVDAHRKKTSKEKVIQQKHYVKRIQVTSVDYSYKEKVKRFYVLGDRKNLEIHVPTSFHTSYCVFI